MSLINNNKDLFNEVESVIEKLKSYNLQEDCKDLDQANRFPSSSLMEILGEIKMASIRISNKQIPEEIKRRLNKIIIYINKVCGYSQISGLASDEKE